MPYVDVLVRSRSYHGTEALTYAWDEAIPVGSVVAAELRRSIVYGIVLRSAGKPSFKVKPLKAVYDIRLPAAQLELLDWLTAYYPAPLGQIVSLFLPPSLANLTPQPMAPGGPARELPPLTDEQTAAVQTMLASPHTTALLHGETGSGKTRVYLELARKAMAAGRSSLLLTPEIGLTSQLQAVVEAAFPGQTLVIHSTLTALERRKIWYRLATAAQPLVVIGPRSALFSPIHHLGLIVIDEVHDQAYKQEQAPHYQATVVAARLAQAHKARLVMGSATPLVALYRTLTEKKLPIIRMTQPAIASQHAKTHIEVINLRERQHFTRSPWLSDELITATALALERGEQSLLFLNRRGSARVVLCQACGWQAVCDHCDLPLTYHADRHELRCHTCGHQAPVPVSCPVCQAVDILFRTAGTKAIVGEVEKVFPRARVQRFDSDNVKLERLEHHYEAVKNGDIDILVGTQMLSKGLDLPKLSVVGILQADSSLGFPDYTAEERTFQQLSQVIGRVGRGHRPGYVYVQSYDPESPLLQAAVRQDWDSFYELQLKERQAYLFPPYCFLLKLSIQRATAASAKAAAVKLTELLKRQPLKIQVIGPAPSFYEKAHDKYQWQLVIKAKDRRELLQIIPMLPSGWVYDLDPYNLL